MPNDYTDLDPLDLISPPPSPPEEDEESTAAPDWQVEPGSCGSFSSLGKCGDSHFHAKKLVCGRDWCQTCGKKGSITHFRRSGRQMAKVLSMKAAGYFDFTIPLEMRRFFYLPWQLADMGRYLRRKFRREFPGTRGFSRWHFAGDCKSCDGKGFWKDEKKDKVECETCGGSGLDERWHPHLNVIFECGYMDPQKLEGIKKDYADWLKEKTHVVLVDKKPVSYYQYSKDQTWPELDRRYKQFVRYVLRPTFSEKTCQNYEKEFGSDPKLIFRNFRNTCELGQNKKGFYFNLDNLDHPKKEKAPRPVKEYILTSKSRTAMHLSCAGDSESFCSVCGKIIKWLGITGSIRGWKYDKGGHAVLSNQQYLKARQKLKEFKKLNC